MGGSADLYVLEMALEPSPWGAIHLRTNLLGPNRAPGLGCHAPPLPPLFPFESLKQASGLGWRAPLANWAWSNTGASRLPSCFICRRLFAELDARGGVAWERVTST
jgi:hypothetical protein